MTLITDSVLQAAKDIRIVFFDVDDTLKVKNTAYLPDSAAEAITRLQDAGYLTAIATGRSYYALPDDIKALGADYYVTINGQYALTSTGASIYKNPITPSAITILTQWADSLGISYGFVGANGSAISKWSDYARGALSNVHDDLPIDKFFYIDNDVFQMWLFTQDELELPPAVTGAIRILRWHEYAYDVIPRTGSKAKGIAAVVKRLGLTADNAMAFGDELNDLEMFDYVGLSVAMGNAHLELKKRADVTTLDLTDDGILHALEKLGMI
ncbi:MAG: Cof-type HAD-IIB family hydrolase [Clostridiales Family XIII bacterium]|jgi:Cof subfamily protein (haloacid dehalogenase superfamily)|nr:Cof-type HAD-IIB family hydrolase [Clostridiales Family XIII bacterium]